MKINRGIFVLAGFIVLVLITSFGSCETVNSFGHDDKCVVATNISFPGEIYNWYDTSTTCIRDLTYAPGGIVTHVNKCSLILFTDIITIKLRDISSFSNEYLNIPVISDNLNKFEGYYELSSIPTGEKYYVIRFNSCLSESEIRGFVSSLDSMPFVDSSSGVWGISNGYELQFLGNTFSVKLNYSSMNFSEFEAFNLIHNASFKRIDNSYNLDNLSDENYAKTSGIYYLIFNNYSVDFSGYARVAALYYDLGFFEEVKPDFGFATTSGSSASGTSGSSNLGLIQFNKSVQMQNNQSNLDNPNSKSSNSIFNSIYFWIVIILIILIAVSLAFRSKKN